MKGGGTRLWVEGRTVEGKVGGETAIVRIVREQKIKTLIRRHQSTFWLQADGLSCAQETGETEVRATLH